MDSARTLLQAHLLETSSPDRDPPGKKQAPGSLPHTTRRERSLERTCTSPAGAAEPARGRVPSRGSGGRGAATTGGAGPRGRPPAEAPSSRGPSPPRQGPRPGATGASHAARPAAAGGSLGPARPGPCLGPDPKPSRRPLRPGSPSGSGSARTGAPRARRWDGREGGREGGARDPGQGERCNQGRPH